MLPLSQDNLIENAGKMGKYLMDEIAKLPNIKEVRGKGLMIGIELFEDTAAIRKKLVFEEKIFVGSSIPY